MSILAIASNSWPTPLKVLGATAFLAVLVVWATDPVAIVVFPSSAIPTNGWISAPPQPNFTAILLSRLLAPGGTLCRDALTSAVSLPALDAKEAFLPTGAVHEFTMAALDDTGSPRCLGGDYFETDLSSDRWKSRPPVVDLDNGSYSLKLQVHPDYAGDYNLTIILLFRSFDGLRYSTKGLSYHRELRRIPITFHRTQALLPQLRICSTADFNPDSWSGRWTRLARNDSCSIDPDGRFRCLAPTSSRCPSPWCDGSLSALESNGWVYSAHCSFKIFDQDSAWNCLKGRWIFFWGDSHHVDTIRNMLNFALGISEIQSVPRRFDTNFTNPRNSNESVRITSIFNGHWKETENYLGLQSLHDEDFRRLITRYFTEEERSPDAVILNSGLHDSRYWKSIQQFSEEGADFAVEFWNDVISRAREKPRVFFRSTVATGGYARDLEFNPSKMEVFNGIFVEKLRKKGLLISGGVIDDFDMTFPWHYDHRYSDGVHYGRPPAKEPWRDGEVGHQYFVDLMLVHVILNAICNI